MHGILHSCGQTLQPLPTMETMPARLTGFGVFYPNAFIGAVFLIDRFSRYCLRRALIGLASICDGYCSGEMLRGSQTQLRKNENIL